MLKEDNKEKYAVFGYADKETANRLREFFYKHTDTYIDFASFLNTRRRFILLVFSIPLKNFQEIGITASSAVHGQKFCSLNDFIYWYEQIYLPNFIN